MFHTPAESTALARTYLTLPSNSISIHGDVIFLSGLFLAGSRSWITPCWRRPYALGEFLLVTVPQVKRGMHCIFSTDLQPIYGRPIFTEFSHIQHLNYDSVTRYRRNSSRWNLQTPSLAFVKSLFDCGNALLSMHQVPTHSSLLTNFECFDPLSFQRTVLPLKSSLPNIFASWWISLASYFYFFVSQTSTPIACPHIRKPYGEVLEYDLAHIFWHFFPFRWRQSVRDEPNFTVLLVSYLLAVDEGRTTIIA